MSSQSELEEALKFTSNNILRVVASFTASIPESQRTPTQTQMYPELSPIREEACGASRSFPDRHEDSQPSTESVQFTDNQDSISDLLRIKLQMAEAKAKIHQLKRAKKACGRDDWAQWKTEKKELISNIKQLKSEHRNLGRNHCYKQQRGCGGKFRARFISTQLKNHTFVPGENFTEVFRVRNEGDSAWPEGTVMMPIGKNTDHGLLGSAGKAIPVTAANSGQCVDVAVSLHAPQSPGRYHALWRLATPDGIKFGQRLELRVNVSESSSDSEEEPVRAASSVDWLGLLKQLEDMGWSDKPKNLRLLRSYNGNLSLVVTHLIEDSS